MTMHTHITTDSAERKEIPIATGVLDYFPLALAAVARLSRIGNDKHNPGQPLHWSREKSTDHADCIIRHMLQRGTIDSDGELHDVKVAWRALAQLQLAEEKRINLLRVEELVKQEYEKREAEASVAEQMNQLCGPAAFEANTTVVVKQATSQLGESCDTCFAPLKAPFTYWYVATPYTKYPTGLENAFKDAAFYTAELLKAELPVYSPIAHTHPVAEFGDMDKVDHDLWVRADKPLLDNAGGIIVIMMQGWRESRGINHEIDEMKAAGKPVCYWNPDWPVPASMLRAAMEGRVEEFHADVAS